MCFVWIWEQTAIISLYSINCLDFITETECVYCAVRRLFTAQFTLHKALPWLRRSVTGLSWRRPRFDLRSVFVRFVGCKVAVIQFFSQYFGFPCQCQSAIASHLSSCTYCSNWKDKLAKPGNSYRYRHKKVLVFISIWKAEIPSFALLFVFCYRHAKLRHRLWRWHLIWGNLEQGAARDEQVTDGRVGKSAQSRTSWICTI
jgi:hypothetical protein